VKVKIAALVAHPSEHGEKTDAVQEPDQSILFFYGIVIPEDGRWSRRFINWIGIHLAWKGSVAFSPQGAS